MASEDTTLRAIRARGEKFDLAVGYPRRCYTPAEREVFDRLGRNIDELDEGLAPELEKQFLQRFFELGAQTRTEWMQWCGFHYSASSCIQAIADLMKARFSQGGHQKDRDNAPSVAVIEPLVDFIPKILKGAGLDLEVLPEDWLSDKKSFQQMYTLKSDAIFICLPNNPSGFMMSPEMFVQLVNFCHEARKTLIIDNCFRFYASPEKQYDQYAFLSQPGQEISALMIEDTGKTWPMKGEKTAFISASANLAYDLSTIMHTTIAYPPTLTLSLAIELMALPFHDNHVGRNRATLAAALKPFGVDVLSPEGTSMAWLDTGPFTGENFADRAGQAGVMVVPGSDFLWNKSTQATKDHRVRVALPRDVEMCDQAMAALRGQFQP